MPQSFEESLDECLTVLQREFIIFGSDKPTFTEMQEQAVSILVRGGVTARDFAFAIESNDMEYVFDDDQWRDILCDALMRRADITREIGEAQK
jgi:hypothetical protein